MTNKEKIKWLEDEINYCITRQKEFDSALKRTEIYELRESILRSELDRLSDLENHVRM